MSNRHCPHGKYSVVECAICSPPRALRNHPGWGKGAIVRTESGAIADVLEDGRYVSGADFGLWHYRIAYRTGPAAGMVFDHVPMMSDELILPAKRP